MLHFAFVDMMPVLVAADQLQSEVERLQGCVTESLQQTKESANHRNKRRHYGEKNNKKDRYDLTCGSSEIDRRDSSVQFFSHLPTHRQNRLATETQVGAELKVSVDRPNGDGALMASRNLHQSSTDIDHNVEPVRSSENADQNSDAVDSRIDDYGLLLPSVDVQSQQDHDIQTHQENTVVSRREDDLSQHDSVALQICGVMTTRHEAESSPSRAVVDSDSNIDAGGVDVKKKCLTSDVCATQNDSEDNEPNPDVVLDVGENRCTMPDDYRLHNDSQPDDGTALDDHMVHNSASQNDTVPRSPLPDNSNVLDDTVSVDGTVLDYTEPDCERSIHTNLHAKEVLQVEDDVHREHTDRMLDDESGSQRQEGIRLEHKMDFREKWQDPARQSDKEMGKDFNVSIHILLDL